MAKADLAPTAKAFDQRKRLLVVQAGAILAAGLLLFSEPALKQTTMGQLVMEAIGIVFVLICITGRLWSILYVGGRKNDELVSTGPFSITQNPLYFFSTIGAAGIGLMFGSLVVAAALGGLSFMIFSVTARKEAGFLLGKFGDVYQAYARKTPRFWPNPFIYSDQVEWRFSPPALKRTFVDGLYFLALFPVIKLLDYLRATNILPTFMTLY